MSGLERQFSELGTIVISECGFEKVNVKFEIRNTKHETNQGIGELKN